MSHKSSAVAAKVRERVTADVGCPSRSSNVTRRSVAARWSCGLKFTVRNGLVSGILLSYFNRLPIDVGYLVLFAVPRLPTSCGTIPNRDHLDEY